MPTDRPRRILLLTLVVALAAGNLAMNRREPHDAQSAVWWKNYNWKKTDLRLYIVLPASYNEGTRAANAWNGATKLTLGSGTKSNYDILLWDVNFGDIGWRGQAVLQARSDGTITQCVARLNTYYTSFPPNRSRSWRWQGTHCMELGHCVGLAHDLAPACMNSEAMNDGTSGANAPGSSQIRAINSRY